MKISLAKLAAASALALLFNVASVHAQTVIASDDASQSAYSSGWTDGTNGGTGFNAWDLTNNNNGTTSGTDNHTNFAGYFIGDSTLGGGNINISGKAFGVYANPGTAFADAARSFSEGALQLNQTFSIELAVNFRNGNKGIDLIDGSTTIFNLNIGADKYTVANASVADDGNGGSTNDLFGDAYSANTIFTLSFVQTSVSGGTWNVTRSGGLSGSANGTFTGDATRFKLYNAGTDPGGAAENNLYANALSISVPEPSSFVLLSGALFVGGVWIARHGSKRH